jgi:hypothetical protein
MLSSNDFYEKLTFDKSKNILEQLKDFTLNQFPNICENMLCSIYTIGVLMLLRSLYCLEHPTILPVRYGFSGLFFPSPSATSTIITPPWSMTDWQLSQNPCMMSLGASASPFNLPNNATP